MPSGATVADGACRGLDGRRERGRQANGKQTRIRGVGRKMSGRHSRRGRRHARCSWAMVRDYPRRLTLEVDPDEDPIRGRVCEGDEMPEPFVGWLGMARALERTLSRRPGAGGSAEG